MATLVLFLAACGGGGGGGGGSDGNGSEPLTDDAARRAVLSDIGEDLILPSLRTLDMRAQTQAAAVNALVAVPGEASVRSDAQAAWRSAMAAVQRAEIFALGPAARSSAPGGADLRDQIYAYPLFNRCRVHRAAYADEAVTATSAIDGTGMGALEYLLFDDSNNADCAPAAGIDAQAKRAQHAGRIAARIGAVAADLRQRWEPGGGNFLRQFAAAGAGSTVFATPKAALDALTAAIFYAEQETKDRKLASPTGIGSVRLPECPTVSCPERAESPFARVSGDHIAQNLLAFRDVFGGASGSMGLNALLTGINRQDLASEILVRIDAAIATEAQIEDFEDAVAAIPDRTACINASANRSGEPRVCRLHGLVDNATDLLRADIASALNLMIPNNAAGDND